MPCIQSGDGHASFFQEVNRACIRNAPQRRRNLVESLAQSFSRGDSTDSKGLPEMVVIPAIGYSLEITFSDCEKSYITAYDVVNANTVGTYRKSILGLGRQRAEFVHAQSNKSQSGVRGIEFFLGLRDHEFLHVFTSQVSSCEMLSMP